MRSLLMITTSRRQKDVWRRYIPTVGWIHRSLFPAQLSQICCQSSEITLLTRGKISEAGSFIGETESERAAQLLQVHSRHPSMVILMNTDLRWVNGQFISALTILLLLLYPAFSILFQFPLCFLHFQRLLRARTRLLLRFSDGSTAASNDDGEWSKWVARQLADDINASRADCDHQRRGVMALQAVNEGRAESPHTSRRDTRSDDVP